MFQFCERCGSSLSPENQFCGQCGKKIEVPQTAPQSMDHAPGPLHKPSPASRTSSLAIGAGIVVAALAGIIGLWSLLAPDPPEVKACEAWFEYPNPLTLQMSGEEYFTWLEGQTAPAAGTPVGRAFSEYIFDERQEDFFWDKSRERPGDWIAQELLDAYMESSDVLEEDLIARCDAVLLLK